MKLSAIKNTQAQKMQQQEYQAEQDNRSVCSKTRTSKQTNKE